MEELKHSNEKKPVKKEKETFSDKLADTRAEAKKIIWPNKETVMKNTGIVIVTSLIFGALLFAMDTVYTGIFDLIIGLLA